MKTTLEAKEQNLAKIFSDDYLFSIPPYQRPYAWTIEQTTELFEDLTTALPDASNIEDIAPYFLGSIVLIKDPKFSKAEVIDGQQRLTTLTILFCVLRELAADFSADIDTYVREKGREIAGTQDRYRLSLRERDREFFKNNIQDPGNLENLIGRDVGGLDNDSQLRFLENAKYLKKAVSNLNPNKQKQLAKFLVQRCYLVVVSVSDRNSAYRIFSVMNARGLDLLPTDILKAEIIGEIPASNQEGYTVKWEDAEEEVGRESFHELFSHIRMIFVKNKAKGTLEHEFREGVMKVKPSSDLIDDVIIPYQKAYWVISGVAYESAADAQAVNAYLRYLVTLDNRDWVAPAIAFFKNNAGNHDALAHFVKNLERLAYAMFILRHDVNKRIRRYTKVLNAIEMSRENDLNKSLQLDTEEKNSVIDVLSGPIYQQKRICKTVLLRLDSILADATATYEHPRVTIEHVLPQSPAENSQWLKDFPDEEQRREWTDKLANLVLLSRTKNSQAQNFDFDRKNKEYFRKGTVSTFALTTQVTSEDEWTPETLEARQATLLDVLKKEWELG